MEITIEEKKYTLKYTIRTFFIFEQLADRQYEATRLMDSYLLFYSMLLANNPDEFKLTFDEFIDVCDNDSNLFQTFIEFINKEFSIENQFVKTDKKKAMKKK